MVVPFCGLYLGSYKVIPKKELLWKDLKVGYTPSAATLSCNAATLTPAAYLLWLGFCCRNEGVWGLLCRKVRLVQKGKGDYED